MRIQSIVLCSLFEKPYEANVEGDEVMISSDVVSLHISAFGFGKINVTYF